MAATTGTASSPPPFYHEQVDSDFRLSGTTSDFTWQCKSVIKDMPANIAWNRVCVEDIACPKSYYLIAAPYNCFTLQEGATQVTITIPPGQNYNRANFATIVTALLNAASPGHFTYAITYPGKAQPDTGLYTYSVTGNGAVQPIIVFLPTQPCTVHKQMGFNPGSTNQFVANTLTSVNFINFQLDWFLNLTSDVCENDGNNILITINMSSTDNASVGNDLTIHPLFGKRFDMSKFNGRIKFSLLSTDGMAINLNGLPLKFNLKFWRESDSNTQAPPAYGTENKFPNPQQGMPGFGILDPSITNPGILAAYGQSTLTDPDGVLVDYETLHSGMLTAPENQVQEPQPTQQPEPTQDINSKPK